MYVRPLLPNWNLPSVLWKLCDYTLEPIDPCDMEFLTWKTTFLVTLLTASRVSEIQALTKRRTFRKEWKRTFTKHTFLCQNLKVGKAMETYLHTRA